MVKFINPDKKSFQRRDVIRQLPAVNQTETLQKFFGATVNHLFQPGSAKPVNGYIGRKPGYYNAVQDYYIGENTAARDFYQLEPAVVSLDPATKEVTNLLFYPDLINYLRFNGAVTNNHDRLFEQEYYSWCPPVDLDKLLNFREYYWIKEGPDTKEIVPNVTYTCDGTTKKFKLPKTRLTTDDYGDVVVMLNGRELLPQQEYTLTTTEVNLFVIPSEGSKLYIRSFEAIRVSDIEGRQQFTTPASIEGNTVRSGFNLSSGMKIRLHFKDEGPTYYFEDYIVEGVGRSIKLIPDSTMTTQDIIPHIQYAGDDSTAEFSLPSGDNTHGVLVRVDNVDVVANLHYELKGSKVVFYKTYIPKAKAKVDIWLKKPINIDDIIGAESYTTPLMKPLVNGQKIRLVGLVSATNHEVEDYLDHEFFVQGVGKAIKLVKDDGHWKNLDFKDYFVMERGDRVQNPWSVGNRWFHRSVIDFTKLNNTIVVQQAKRPIVEFQANMELFSYGRFRRAEIATVVMPRKDANGNPVLVEVTDEGVTTSYETITNAFQQINGKDAATINGVALKSGMRILLTHDSDDLINNRVYLVTFTTTGKIRLTMETDGAGESGAPIKGEIMRVTKGDLAGKEFYWDGLSWKEAQQKSSINQVPLFQLYDVNGNPLDDAEVYPESSFAGNPVFGYQFSPDTRKKADPELNRRLMFTTTGKSSEIVFENYLYSLDILGGVQEITNTVPHALDSNGLSQRYTYLDRASGERANISGYYFHNTLAEAPEDDLKSNDWYVVDKPSRQYVVASVVAQDSEVEITVPVLPTSASDVEIFKNGLKLESGEYRLTDKTVSIAAAKPNDFFEVRAWSAVPEEMTSFFEVPLNLQANPDNREVTTITRGGFYPQFSEIIQGQKGFSGRAFADNNYRDTSRARNIGTKILQHTSSLMKTMICASNQDLDVMMAARYVEREYGRFKNKIIQKTEEFLRRGVMDPDTQTAEMWLDGILQTINYGKTDEFPFNNGGVGARTATEKTFIPPTPSYLGLYPCFQPEIYVDDSYPTPQTVIRGHDGSITLAYGDIRDDVLMELETRIYQSIDEKFRNGHPVVVDTTRLREGKFRRFKVAPWAPATAYVRGQQVYFDGNHHVCTEDHTSGATFSELKWRPIARAHYSREETIRLYRPMFERWCAFNSINSRRNDQFDPSNQWTWNWSSARDVDGEMLPGHWRGIYQWFFDTDCPHTRPWEMLGLTNKPDWWDTRYGVAPYTRGNKVLWDDLEHGYIAEGPRAGHDPAYARPGLHRFIPVDDMGNLLSPVEMGIVQQGSEPSFMDASKPWEVGDCGPAENTWKRSEAYSFSMAMVAYLMKPARFVEMGWDTLACEWVNGQYLNVQTGNRPYNLSLTMHNEKDQSGKEIRRIGLQQWISDWVKSRGQDISLRFGQIIRNLDVRLSYKVGGFTNIDSLVAVADNFDQVPQEDISIRLYRSPSIREEFYGGVIIEWTGASWRVFGYDVINPVFRTIPSDVNGPSTFINLGGDYTPDYPKWNANTYYAQSSKVEHQGKVWRATRAHTSSRIFEQVYWEETTAKATPTVVRVAEFLRPNIEGEIRTVPYGTEFSTQQEVYDFLISYQRYLETRGWKFDGFDSDGNTEDFRKAGKDFLYWSLIELPAGNFLAVSPLAKTVKFVCEHGTVQNIEQVINGVYSILNKEGFPINVKKTNVTRYNNDVTVRATDEAEGIYACRLYVSEIEHVVLFNNKTIFNDTIYEPVLNLRQHRLRLQAFKTVDWKGRMDAPGFIVTDNLLLPNFEKSADNFRHMFDIENFDEPTLQEYARANIGYRRRGYLDNLLLSPTSQFDFYQGMIRQKGSRSSMKRILRSTHVSGGAEVHFMEEWAFRIGMYGATDIRNSLELSLRQNQIRNNPQLVQFTNTSGTEVNDDPWDDVINIFADDERWIRKPLDLIPGGELQVFELTNSRTKGELSLAGPVKLGETKWTFTGVDQFLDAVRNQTAFELGDYAWIYCGGTGKYDILRFAEKETKILSFYRSTDGLRNANVIVDGDVTGGLLVVEGNDVLPDGIYELSKPTSQTNTWVRNFSYDDAMPSSKSFTKTVNLANPTDLTSVSADVVSLTIIPAKEAIDLALLRKITLRTVETDGDNFRGLWKKKWMGIEATTQQTTISAAFGADYVGQGVAFPMLNGTTPFHNTKMGLVNVYLNGAKLAAGSYFLSSDGAYLFVSSMLRQGSSLQYRAIRETDEVEVEILSNPRISIGTDSNPQRFFRLANTPDLVSPTGIVESYDVPFHLSLNANNEPDIREDVKIFIHHDGATQGKLRVTIDAVAVGADDQQQTLEFPANTAATINSITVEVQEAFDAENVFGNNQLYVGDMENPERFIGSTNVPATMLHTRGVKTFTPNTSLPFSYQAGEKLVINFAQAWSTEIMKKYGYTKTEDTTSFDYLTTPDEFFRKVPFTYIPGSSNLEVKINGETRLPYNPATDAGKKDWNDLRYNILEGDDFSFSVYFGRKLQNGTTNAGVFTPTLYSVDDSNTTRIYPLPGTPNVVFTRQPGDTGTGNANFIPIIGGGAISEIIVTDGGSNYLPGYTEVSIVGGNGNGAQAKPVIVNGTIQSIIIEDAGENYTSVPMVLITDTSPRANDKKGSGAKAQAKLFNNGVSGYVRVDGGSYSVAPLVDVVPNLGATATAVLGKAAIQSFTIVGGQNYTTATVTITPAPVEEATAKAYINADGRLAVVAITNPGAHYAVAPTVVFNNDNTDGNGAAAEAILNDLGQVAYIKITNYGAGYTSAPVVTLVGGASGTATTTTATIVNGVITAIAAPTNLYMIPPTVTITGNGTGASATANLAPRAIAGVKVGNTGANYGGRMLPTDKLQIRVAPSANGPWTTLRNLTALNEGYTIINNMIYFLKAPRFGAGAVMDIILHNAVQIPRSEDVDIRTPNTPFRAATSGSLKVSVSYTVESSQMKYLSDLNGNPLDDGSIGDPFANLPENGATILSKTWESVVFRDKPARDAFQPYTAWKTDDRCWVEDNGTGKWETYRVASVTNGVPSWEIVRTESPRIDNKRIRNALIYNKRTNRIVTRLQLWNPAAGYVPGIAESEIAFKLDYDPAYYTTGNTSLNQIDEDQAWGREQVGMVWWDTSTTLFLNYEIGNENENDNLNYRAKHWGQIAPGTSLDLYEWTRSPVPPAEWEQYVKRESKNATKGSWYPTGTVKNPENPSWVVSKEFNARSGTEDTYYYFWVKNSSVVPAVEFRHVALNRLADAILNPSSNDMPWFAVVDQRTVMVGNVRQYLNDEDTVLQINWDVGDNEGNVHKQWMLLREGDERSLIPTSLWTKMTDSLVGWDAGQDFTREYEEQSGTLGELTRSRMNNTPVDTAYGPRLVPDPELNMVEMIGNQFRPRQTWFIPEVSYKDGNKVYRPSLKARKHLVSALNRIFYLDEIALDMDNPPFAVTTPYPVGRKAEFKVEDAGQNAFILPRDFNMDGGSVWVIDVQGNATIRTRADSIEDAVHGVNYVVERVKINNVYYNRIVFPQNANPYEQDPKRYSRVIVKSGEYYELTATDLLDRDELFLAGRLKKGDNILVQTSDETYGFWTLWKCNAEWSEDTTSIPADTWSLVMAQTYDLRDFVEELDWWMDGYTADYPLLSTYDTTAHRNSALPTPNDGDIVKVRDDGTGKWIVTVWKDNTWVVVGRERYVKRFSSKFYDGKRTVYAGPGYKWDDLTASNFLDIKNRDGSWELKILLDHLNAALASGGDGLLNAKQANELFFSMVYFAHTQQNMIDWAFKTSFLYLGGYNEPLVDSPIQTADQSEALQSYLEEVKPYHVKVRDFVRRLSPRVDSANLYVTDFDKAPMYDASIAATLPSNDKSYAYRPLRVNPNGDGTYTIGEEDYDVLQNGYWPQNVPATEPGRQYWRDWLNNSGINPGQPEGMFADTKLVRRTKTTVIFDRKEEIFPGQLGDGTGGNGDNEAGTGIGWGGAITSLGWDIPSWDMETEAVSSAASLEQWYKPRAGMPKNDPATLIDGVDYRGSYMDGYTFQNEEVDVTYDGGQMDRAGVESAPYDIDVDGGDFQNPYYDEGHPPELIKVRTSDPMVMSVYQTFSPGAPLILSQKHPGGKDQGDNGLWGPYSIGQEAQSQEAILVHVDGQYKREGEDYIVDSVTGEIWFNAPVSAGSMVTITSLTVGGGTPYQTKEYEGDRITSRFKVPDLGKMMASRVHVFGEFTNDLAISEDGQAWTLRNTTWNERLYGVAYGAGKYVAVGDRIRDIEVELITRSGTTATVKTKKPHGLTTGMTVTVRGAVPAGYNQTATIEVTGLKTFTYQVVTGLTTPAAGLIFVDGPSRIISSTDMVFWNAEMAPTITNLKGVFFLKNMFVALGELGTLLTSTDGMNWTQRIVGTTATLSRIAYVENRNTWILVGQGVIFRSTDDCVTWQQTIKESKLTVGMPIPTTGRVSAKDDVQEWVTPALRATLSAANHQGLSMGVYDPMYEDISGNPLDPNDNDPFLWQVDSITVVEAGVDAPDSPPEGWLISLEDGKGRPATFRIHTDDGEVKSLTMVDYGEYEVRPYQAAFKIDGTALAGLGIVAGRFMTAIGVVTNPTVTAGSKLTIGKTTITFRTDSDLTTVINQINQKTNKHNVIASNEGGRLKLSIPPMWNVVEAEANTLPIGARFTVTFRPLGAPLNEGIDTLLQNLLVWEDGDLILLNGQTDPAKNGLYKYLRGGPASEYNLVHPEDNRVGVPLRPTFVYDKNDGIGYTLTSNGTYRQFTLNLNDLIYRDGTLVAVGGHGTILSTTDLHNWAVINAPDRTRTNLNCVAADSEKIIAIGDNGYMIKSADGYVWEAMDRISDKTINGICASDAGWFAVGDAGGLFFSQDGLKNWKQSDVDIRSNVLSIQFVNNRFVATYEGVKRQRRLTAPEDFTIVGNEIVFDPAKAPLLPPGHTLKIVNMGTIIEGQKHFVTKTAATTVYKMAKVSPSAKNYMMVSLNGVILPQTAYEYTMGVTTKGDPEMALTLNVPMIAGFTSGMSLIVTVFNGPDPAVVETDSYTVASDKTNVRYINTGKTWTSGYFVEGAFGKGLSQKPGSIFPEEGTVIVKKNGKELLPPDVEYFIGDAQTTNFPFSPPVNPQAKVEVYVNGVQKSIGSGMNKDAYLVMDYNSNKLVELAFRNHAVPPQDSSVVIVVYDGHEYVVDLSDATNPKVLLISEPNVGDEISVVSFAENTAMKVSTEVFRAEKNNNFYIIKHRPYNADHMWVSVNGDAKTHMKDYQLENLTLGGWDTFVWGGAEQFGKWRSLAANPDYTEYKNAGGKPPVWNGLKWVEGQSINQPFSVVPYSSSHVDYTGPVVNWYSTSYTHQGPPIEAYSWDSEYEGAIVKFDTTHLEGDKIKVTVFSGDAFRPPMAWRVFRNGHDQWDAVRIADAHKTYLAEDLMVTDYSERYTGDNDSERADFEKAHGQVIKLYANPNVPMEHLPHIILPVPNREANVPGIVWIGGERIEYFEIKYLDDNGDYLVDAGGRYMELRNLKRGSQGTAYGIKQELRTFSTGNGFEPLTSADNKTFDLGETFYEVFVTVDGVQMYQQAAWEDHYAPHAIDEVEATYFTLDGSKVVFNKELPEGAEVRISGVVTDYKHTQITHKAGELAIDGSYQQQLSSFRPFEISNLNKKKPVGLGHSKQESVRFLVAKPGTYE